MQNKSIILVVTILILLSCKTENTSHSSSNETTNSNLLAQLNKAAKEDLLDKWYPLVIDSVDGGYFSDVTHDFKLATTTEKMIVTQSRHIWTTATAALSYPDQKEMYLSYAHHGFEFLKNKMWDSIHGGFYSFVTKNGALISRPGQNKTAYGNSFGIYGLATYYKASNNKEALELAKKTFMWLEKHSHDPIHKGYYQTLDLTGSPLTRNEQTPSTSDIGYKDQNSSIHLLEAFTALYEVWPDELVAKRTEELLLLIRDTITNDKNSLTLFLQPDWTPVSFKAQDSATIAQHFYLDHVSFGHDVETAYLMLEASHALGINDSLTLQQGKKMVDHALHKGWDTQKGGFYDGGYYYKDSDTITIVNDAKNWWSQAEGLNTLLIMSKKFPEDELSYQTYFDKLWEYTQTYLIDDTHGGWYEWGIDQTPQSQKQKKVTSGRLAITILGH